MGKGGGCSSSNRFDDDDVAVDDNEIISGRRFDIHNRARSCPQG